MIHTEHLEALGSQYLDPYVSLSKLREFSKDDVKFEKNYILGDWDDFTDSEAMIIGSALHRGLEKWYTGEANTYNQVVAIISEFVEDYPEERMKETVNREQTKKNAVSVFYMISEYLPEFDEVELAEKSITTGWTHVDGREAILPVNGVIDIAGVDGDVTFVGDWKSTNSFTENLTDNPSYVIQAVIYYILYTSYRQSQGYTGEDCTPDEFRVYELKKTKSLTEVYYLQDCSQPKAKAGEIKPYQGKKFEELQEQGVFELYNKEPQVQELKFVYEDNLWAFQVVDFMLKALIVNVAMEKRYPIPNFGDFMDGKETWDWYLKQFAEYYQDFKLPQLNEDYEAVRTARNDKDSIII